MKKRKSKYLINEQWLIQAKKFLNEKKSQRIRLFVRNESFKREIGEIKKRIGAKFFTIRKKIKSLNKKDLPFIDELNQQGQIFVSSMYNEIEREIIKYPLREHELPYLIKPLGDGDGFPQSEKPKIKVTYQKKIDFKHKCYLCAMFKRFNDMWSSFCIRWSINTKWAGNMNDLWKYLEPEMGVFKEGHFKIPENRIAILISKWASLKDIRAQYNDIEQAQKQKFGKIEVKSNFGRDLRWYDLSNQGWSIRQIAKNEVKHYENDVNELVAGSFKSEETMEKEDVEKANRLSLKKNDLYRELTSGRFKDKYKESFKEYNEYYQTGRSVSSLMKSTTTRIPFYDTIQKAIERMRKQIADLNPAKEPTNIPFLRKHNDI